MRAGFNVTPTDGSPGLAREAEKRLGRPVSILYFEDIDERDTYIGVWANACLLHVPADRLGDVLARVHAALRPGGRFYASYKMGEGGERDSLDCYYNFPSCETLTATDGQSGNWSGVAMDEGQGGLDCVRRTFLHVTAIKP